MCNLYQSTRRDMINLRHSVRLPEDVIYDEVIAPLRPGPIVMAHGASAVAQWGMVPPDSRERIPKTRAGKRMSTNNCRTETMASAWTFRFAWGRGQRCLIPADSYDEPYWGTGKNIWWRFRRADGTPWALAGLWSEWVDPVTGHVVPNYTMLTQNCDSHALLRQMHRPDPKLPSDGQDKRSVVPIEPQDWDAWLHGTKEQALALVQLPEMGCITHGAAEPEKHVELPLF
jgi:putative SOS response-associated peptidase YedK